MESYVLVAIEKGRVEIKKINVPEPGPGEIQVRVKASVISPGTERAFILGLENTNAQYPYYLGYSAAGIVEKTGSSVANYAPGDRVAAHGLNHGTVGNVSAERAVHIPEEITFENAAFTALGVISLQGVRKASIELGESVLIIGMGPIGQLASQFSLRCGALPVICADISEKRLEIAKECGAHAVVNTNDASWQADVKSLTCGKGPHVAIESTGFAEPINFALKSVRMFGRVVLLGSTRGKANVNFYTDVHKKAITIIGAHVSANPQYDSYPRYWSRYDNAVCFMSLLKVGYINLKPLITKRAPWEQSYALYKDVLSWNTDNMCSVILWDSDEK